jgi:hypothetical protein
MSRSWLLSAQGPASFKWDRRYQQPIRFGIVIVDANKNAKGKKDESGIRDETAVFRQHTHSN